VFLSFPPAAAAQSAAGEAGSSAYSALAAPEGMALTAAARQRVMARTRLVQAQRLHRGS
jgi:hypothetical protein